MHPEPSGYDMLPPGAAPGPGAKPVLKSKTIWFNIVVALGGLGAIMTSLAAALAPAVISLHETGMSKTSVAMVGVVITVIGVVGVWLRTVTKDAIAKGPPRD